MPYETILVEKANQVVTVTLNRPEKLNAWTMKMGEEVAKVISDVTADKEARALVLTGAGRAFCSGVDISVLANAGEGDAVDTPIYESVVWIAAQLRSLNKPVIAAVNGICGGLGLSVALACDIRIASEKSNFSLFFIKRGIVPDTGATYFLPRLVGTAQACELTFTGDPIDAKEAERIGLVNRTVPHEQLMSAVNDLATRIAKGPPIAISLAKSAIYRALDSDLMSHLEYELVGNRIALESEDFKEGIASFMERREPQFKGK